MKTKKKLSSLVVIVLLMMGFTIAKAQSTIPFTNKLPCPVTLIYESWDPNGCSNCSNGTITINAMSTVNVPECCAGCGHCVVLVDIGGTSITTNHTGTSTSCHSSMVGITGPLPGNCNQNATSYTISHTVSSWTIF